MKFLLAFCIYAELVMQTDIATHDVAPQSAYITLPGGKCQTFEHADPKHEWRGGATNCEELCTKLSNCYGYSLSMHSGCLLWKQRDIQGGGEQWGEASCHIKSTQDTVSCGGKLSSMTTEDHIEVKYPFTAEKESYIFDACDSDYDTILHIEDADGNIVTGNDDHDSQCTGTNGAASYLEADLTVGEKYSLVLSGYGDENHGSSNIAITCPDNKENCADHNRDMCKLFEAAFLCFWNANSYTCEDLFESQKSARSEKAIGSNSIVPADDWTEDGMYKEGDWVVYNNFIWRCDDHICHGYKPSKENPWWTQLISTSAFDRTNSATQEYEVIGSTSNFVLIFAILGAVSMLYHAAKGAQKLLFSRSDFQKIHDAQIAEC